MTVKPWRLPNGTEVWLDEHSQLMIRFPTGAEVLVAPSLEDAERLLVVLEYEIPRRRAGRRTS